MTVKGNNVKIKVKHAIITPVCQVNRGGEGAWEEAVARLREEYDKLRVLGINAQANFHVELHVERELNLTGVGQ